MPRKEGFPVVFVVLMFLGYCCYSIVVGKEKKSKKEGKRVSSFVSW